MNHDEAPEPVGFGNCIGCGQPLNEHEMFHGDECDSCKVAYADDDVEGHN